MWTAIFLAAIVAGGTLAYGAWAYRAVAHGAPLWAFIVGYPFAYLAVPLLFAICWFLLAWWFRAERPADVRLSLPARPQRLRSAGSTPVTDRRQLPARTATTCSVAWP